MNRLFLSALAALLITGFSTTSFAGSCPADMKKIDAALAASPSLTSDQMTKVMELRAKGEADHKAGNHGASVNALREAQKILGIN